MLATSRIVMKLNILKVSKKIAEKKVMKDTNTTIWYVFEQIYDTPMYMEVVEAYLLHIHYS